MTDVACRSLLFVPGHKVRWLPSAVACGADGVILDLEDAVADDGKEGARREVATALAGWARDVGERPVLRLVRVNGWGTGHLLADLEAVVGPGLDGICLPKVDGAVDVQALARVLDELEVARGLPPGWLEIFPVAETAAGMRDIAAVCSASPRVRRISGVSHSVPGGDFYRALGAQWDPSGVEALHTGAMTVLAGRAAGLGNILCGPSSSVDDLAHLRAVLARGRTLGADGALCIHPSHVAVAHEVFTPSKEEVAEALAVLAALDEAGRHGDAAVVVDGRMVDLAHRRSSEDVVRRAQQAGLLTSDIVAGDADDP